MSSAGPGKLFKGMTTATSGVLARFPWLLPVRNSFASYGASSVTRTSVEDVEKVEDVEQVEDVEKFVNQFTKRLRIDDV